MEEEIIIKDITGHIREQPRCTDKNVHVNSSLQAGYRFGNIVGKSRSMQKIYELILKASSTENHVVVYGESGTGKELVAKSIHDLSDRANNTFIPVNCGAIPENLIESEFFGYKRGAFSGAVHNKKGLFAEADGGTIFLDEIGEISLNTQVKLLRVIEGGGFTPVGTNHTVYSNVRIIGATNKDLWQLIHQGKLREDFYYRIHIIPIYLPPLRERIEDLPLLIEHFLHSYGNTKTIHDISPQLMERLKNHSWPGNVRELRNVLFRYATLDTIDFMNHSGFSAKETTFGVNAIIANHETQQDLKTILSAIEKQIIFDRLKETNWNKSKTAAYLGIDRKTLLKKIKCYDLYP